MYKLVVFALLTIFNLTVADDAVTDGTELVFTFLVHRHGDRTPVAATLSYSTDPEALAALSEPYGYGQLTYTGKRTSYALGQFLRSRYDGLLSEKYNRSEIYIRSTDSTRTRMTVLTAMAAVYPAGEDNWSEDVNWTPVPYTTVPARYDFNLATVNCPKLISAYISSFLKTSSNMAAYTDVLNTWAEYLSFNITALPAKAYPVYDVYASQMSLGLPIDTGLEEIFPQIEEIAGEAINISFGDDDTIALNGGVLLNEFFTYADMVKSGEETPRVRVYSAHDVNVFALQAVTRIAPRQGVPKYGSMYALELRKVIDTGDYVVLPTYLESPNTGEVTYLQVEGCDSILCSIEEFRNITANYVLDETTWRTKCGLTEDTVLDLSSID